jgi:hypothetical protein
MIVGIAGVIAGGGSGNLPYGTFLFATCDTVSISDYGSNYYTGPYFAVGTYANGSGGTYTADIGENQEGCWHPAGYAYSYSGGDNVINWSSSWATSGSLAVSYSYDNTYADGAGGTYTDSGGGYYVNEGDTIDSKTEFNGAYNIFYAVKWSWMTGSTYEVAWPEAGALIQSECLYGNKEDAAGNFWDVNFLAETIADGSGGSTYNEYVNGICGTVPSGWVYSISTTNLSFDFYDTSNVSFLGSFVYGTVPLQSVSDGTGNTFDNYGTPSIYYSAGYIFYSIYDELTFTTYNYRFDGVNSYYIETSV